MVFHWNFSDNKSSQVSRTLLSILADLNNVVVWMVASRPLISKSTSSSTIFLVTLLRAPITIAITVTFMFHSFPFQFSNKVEILISFFTFFQFYSVISRNSKIHNFASSLFLLIMIRSGRLAEIRWSIFMLKYHRSLCDSFPRTDAWLCINRLFVHANLNSLHNSLWITLPTQLCLDLYSFCANLLHSLIMWLILSSQSPLNLHLLFFFFSLICSCFDMIASYSFVLHCY